MREARSGLDLLANLNPSQREAVTHGEGPLLIFAGAGSGKTRVLTYRVAYLIAARGVRPEQIFCATFTNKAANEMKERIVELVGEGSRGIWMGTFHSLCTRILRAHISHLGRDPHFVIFDEDDQLQLLRAVLKELNLDEKSYPPRTFSYRISDAKSNLIGPDEFAASARLGGYGRQVAARIYQRYEQKLRENNALDFDDLILYTVRLFRQCPEVLEQYQDRFRYILVDEFQDVNASQAEFTRLLARKYRNICVVGDDDQCVVGGTQILTERGTLPVERLQAGHIVRGAAGWGEVAADGVEAVSARPYQGKVIRLSTTAGCELTTTPNHLMFARIEPQSDLHYVYLMYRQGQGYRIGKTQGVRSRKRNNEVVSGLEVRTNQELADKVWILKTCRSAAEASFYEQFFAFHYGIPTTVFHVRGRRMAMTQDLVERLFQEIDTESRALRLMQDWLIFEEYPHHLPNAVEPCFRLMPASHIHTGMKVPVYQDGQIVEAAVTEVEWQDFEGPVYDLSVPNLRNYIANGMVVHNSIYGWRGADVRILLDFEEEYPDAKIVKLEQNYRSTQSILDSANAVISHNRSRRPKALWTLKGRGTPVIVHEAGSEHEEAFFAANTIQQLVREKGRSYSDFAILYRINAQSRVFEEVLINTGIPYRVVGGVRFYDRKEIKDFIAYLRVLYNPLDSISLLRILNVPPRGIGEKTVAALQAMAHQHHLSFYEACAEAVERGDLLPSATQRAVNQFWQTLQALRKDAETMSVVDLLRSIGERTGYLESLHREHTLESASRLENIQELFTVAQEFAEQNPDRASLAAFLENVSLVSDLDQWNQQANAVTLMTLHSAKGLEFPVVFMVGLEEGLLPHQRSLNEAGEMEEERRLCYVGMTRAKEQLFLTYAWRRTVYGRTDINKRSRFLEELPAAGEQGRQRPATAARQGGEERTRRTGPPEGNPLDLMGILAKHRHSGGIRVSRELEQKLKAAETGEASLPAQGREEELPPSYAPGQKVRHPTFGEGWVVEVSGSGQGATVKVAFPEVGCKSLALAYAKLEKVEG